MSITNRKKSMQNKMWPKKAIIHINLDLSESVASKFYMFIWEYKDRKLQ